MTVVLITSTNRYIGDTADTKPTGVPAGSTYFDRETGILYITYDGTNYVEKPSEDTLATLLAGGLPAALAAGGGLKTEGVAGGVAQPVSGTVTADQGAAGAAGWPVKDGGPNWTTVWGLAGVRFTSADASGAETAVSDAPTGGQKLVITDILVSVDTAMRVDFSEEDSAGVACAVYLPANGCAQITPRSKWKLATADKQLMVQTSVAGNIAVTAFYHSEA